MADNIQVQTGTVKFFSTNVNYGFIERKGEDDIFVHVSAVEKSGLKTELMLRGASVDFIVGDKYGRPCVSNIISIKGGDPTQKSQRRNDNNRLNTPSARRRDSNKCQLEVGAIGVGEVISFKENNGFGFLKVFEDGVEDVFLHVNDIPKNVCSEDPKVGDRFHFIIIEHKGKTKAKVTQRYEGNH